MRVFRSCFRTKSHRFRCVLYQFDHFFSRVVYKVVINFFKIPCLCGVNIKAKQRAAAGCVYSVSVRSGQSLRSQELPNIDNGTEKIKATFHVTTYFIDTSYSTV